MINKVKKIGVYFFIISSGVAVVFYPTVSAKAAEKEGTDKIGYLCMGKEIALDFTDAMDGNWLFDGASTKSFTQRKCELPVYTLGDPMVSALTENGRSGVALNRIRVAPRLAMAKAKDYLLRQGWQETGASILAGQKVDGFAMAMFRKNSAHVTVTVVGLAEKPESIITTVIFLNDKTGERKE